MMSKDTSLCMMPSLMIVDMCSVQPWAPTQHWCIPQMADYQHQLYQHLLVRRPTCNNSEANRAVGQFWRQGIKAADANSCLAPH